MSKDTERAMLAAIATHATAEGYPPVHMYAVEVRLVTDPGEEDPAAGRLYYRMGTSWSALAALAAPMTGCPGVADAPALPTYTGL